MIIERIKQETGIDVMLKSRKREQIEMKALASYLLRQKGYSLHQIGAELKLNHSTILHHLKMIDTYKQYNTIIQDVEDKILGKEPVQLPEDIVAAFNIKNREIQTLKNQLKELQENTLIKRLIAILDNEEIQTKLEAFVNINEKARYYKKYED